MFVRMILAFSAILLLVSPAATEDCRTLDFQARGTLIRRAPTCDKAMELYTNCNGGGGGDVILGRIVAEKCQVDFLKRLNAMQRQAYANGIKSCNDEIKEDEGSISRAIAAGCRASLAQSYAHKFGKPRSR